MIEQEDGLPEAGIGDTPPYLESLPNMIFVDDTTIPLDSEYPNTFRRLRVRAVDFLHNNQKAIINKAKREGKDTIAIVYGNFGVALVAGVGLAALVSSHIIRGVIIHQNLKK